MEARTGIETITCHTCKAVYTATFRHDNGAAGSHTCEVCGHVAMTWGGERSYSDFHLIHRPKTWKP